MVSIPHERIFGSFDTYGHVLGIFVVQLLVYQRERREAI